MPFHVCIELMNQTGHSKFRLDCRTKKKTKDGPFALPAHIPLDKVSLFPVSIPLKDLPLKVCMQSTLFWTSMTDIEFQISIPLEIVNSTVFESFNHLLARMMYTSTW